MQFLSMFPAKWLSLILPLSLVLIDIIRRLVRRKLERNGLALPPGPAQIPILGNVLSIDVDQPWKTYTAWRAVYGDMFYVRLLDQDVIILGSKSLAVELFEKRSDVYSDRPFVATHEPYGMDWILAFMPCGETWRQCRRIMHQEFRPEASLALRPMQLRKARQMIVNMIQHPDHYEHNFFLFSTGLMFSVAYDYEPDTRDDPLLRIFKDLMTVGVPAAIPEKALLLRLFSFLLHIPDWFPGSWLKREARRSYQLVQKLSEIPYQHVQDRMRDINERPVTSMVSNHLNRMHESTGRPNSAESILTLKKAAVTTVIGVAAAGSETTVSSLMVFTLAMVLHPHVWKRAQVELDAVVGTERLPNFDDRPALPYVEAIIRETVRWQPVAPLGVWHATTRSDVYNGQFIPKGATVIANTWAMTRDETLFPNAEDFVPERFLDDDGTLKETNPMDLMFGYGRRICPGLYFADASLFATISVMLATLEFHKSGELDAFRVKWLNGITRRPEPFSCRITPRAHVSKAYLEHTMTS